MHATRDRKVCTYVYLYIVHICLPSKTDPIVCTVYVQYGQGYQYAVRYLYHTYIHTPYCMYNTYRRATYGYLGDSCFSRPYDTIFASHKAEHIVHRLQHSTSIFLYPSIFFVALKWLDTFQSSPAQNWSVTSGRHEYCIVHTVQRTTKLRSINLVYVIKNRDIRLASIHRGSTLSQKTPTISALMNDPDSSHFEKMIPYIKSLRLLFESAKATTILSPLKILEDA